MSLYPPFDPTLREALPNKGWAPGEVLAITGENPQYAADWAYASLVNWCRQQSPIPACTVLASAPVISQHREQLRQQSGMEHSVFWHSYRTLDIASDVADKKESSEYYELLKEAFASVEEGILLVDSDVLDQHWRRELGDIATEQNVFILVLTDQAAADVAHHHRLTLSAVDDTDSEDLAYQYEEHEGQVTHTGRVYYKPDSGYMGNPRHMVAQATETTALADVLQPRRRRG